MTAKLILRLLVLFLLPAVAHAACAVDEKAVVPLRDDGGVITVPVEVNGLIGIFTLDTGAQRSLVTQEAVHRLNLARDEWVGTTMRGIGGVESRPNADPSSISLGGIPLVRRTLNHDTSLTVGILPRTRVGTATIDGLLGRDFLSLFDLDLDLPDRQVTLYHVSGCVGRFLPWTGPYESLPVSFPAEDAIELPVAIDGRPLRALLDTGASASLVAAPGMFKLGLDQASLAGDPRQTIAGLGQRPVIVHRHRFQSLRIGNETIDAPVLWVEPFHLTPIVDMLLGTDWLSTRRVWISFTTKQLFMAIR